jgi:2'-5' RNA ligase
VKREDRNFTPHITLGRQVVCNEEFGKLVEMINVDNMTILVDKISLMESTREDGELKYRPIYVKEFR